LLWILGCAGPDLPLTGTRLFETDDDQTILCSNGGFVINQAVEIYASAGHYKEDPIPPGTNPTITGVALDGPTGEILFYYHIVDHVLYEDDDHSMWPQVAAFSRRDSDPAGQCADLPTRSSW
jgi:hypothetical protein